MEVGAYSKEFSLGESKIPWVRWFDVCKPKKVGGLGVRDIRGVNLALLVKCRWCMLSSAFALWVDILVSRYGISKVTSLDGGRTLGHRSLSTWWKGVSLLGSKKDDLVN